MTSGPDRDPTLSRRRLLAVAAAAAFPGACGRKPSPGSDVPSTGPGPSVQPPSGTPDAGPSRTPAPVTGGGGPVAFTPGAVRLGAYLDLRGKSLSESLTLRRRQLGRDAAVLHRFLRWDDDMPRSNPDPRDSTLMISWRGTAYDRITDGSADQRIAAAARRLAGHGDPVLLRWGWDMNRDFYAWGGADNDRDTDGYVGAWRHLHRIFGEEGADNVAWVWSPHRRSTPDEAWNAAARYYPGDRYVDWVGVSGFNIGGESPAGLFDTRYAEYAHRKPIIVTEVAAVDRGGRTKADWIDRFADWVRARPAVGAVVWFDTDTHPRSGEKWRIDSDKRALAAFRSMADDPAFGG